MSRIEPGATSCGARTLSIVLCPCHPPRFAKLLEILVLKQSLLFRGVKQFYSITRFLLMIKTLIVSKETFTVRGTSDAVADAEFAIDVTFRG